MTQLQNYLKTETVPLPNNAHWPTEFAGWRPFTQKSGRAIDGTLHVQAAPLIKGQPIELEEFWLDRLVLVDLWSFAIIPLAKYWLTLPDGREELVMFADESPLNAAPVFEISAPDALTTYKVEALKLFTVSD